MFITFKKKKIAATRAIKYLTSAKADTSVVSQALKWDIFILIFKWSFGWKDY